MKERIIQCFHASAKTYERAADMQRWVAARLASSFPLLMPRNVLEIGCGTGMLSQYLVAAYPHASFSFIDITPAMVKICRQRFSACPGVMVSCADVEALSRDSQFDLIVSNMTLHWLEERIYQLHFLSDLLKPGGELFFSVLGEESFGEWKQVCQDLKMANGILSFPSLGAMRNHYVQWQFTRELISQHYQSAYAFLRSFKQLGTQTPRTGYYPVTPACLRRAIRHFDSLSPSGVDMTYEVVYGSYHQS